MIQRNGENQFVILLLFIGILVGSTQSVSAHRVAIAGWVENNKVVTQSVYSGGVKPKEATVKVFKPNGDLMIEGKTDSEGNFSFIPKELVDLKLVLYAGTGHQATFKIPASEIKEINLGLPQSHASKSKELEDPNQAQGVKDESSIECFDRKGLEEMIEKRINQNSKHQKKPVLEDGPSIASVFSGLGYIVGLIGIASYFNYRRKLGELPSSLKDN